MARSDRRAAPKGGDTRVRQGRKRQLVLGKLRPPQLPVGGAARDRVTQHLQHLLTEHQVVVLSATAGSGKTTAAAAAIREFGRPSSWLTVDRTDVAGGRLVTYLEAAIAATLDHVQDVASEAVANGISHPEAAAILAESVGDHPLVIVLDELERLGTAPEAWAVIESFLRYSPPSVSTLLISRRSLPIRPPGVLIPVVDEDQLAFTAEEAGVALAALGLASAEADSIVARTGGWVTGVLFAANVGDQPAGTPWAGKDEPLYDYISAHVLEQLEPEDHEFLVCSALLDEVSHERAAQLGLQRPGERLASLRAAHVPVTWTPEGSMRCHSCFREFLLDRLQRRDPTEIAQLRKRYARLLVTEGHDEEAVEELLAAGALDEALAPAVRAITGIIERRDFEIADRWLHALNAAEELTTAEIMLAIARDDYRAGARIADQLAAIGRLAEVVRSSEHAAVLLVWAYLLHARSADARAILDALDPGPVADTIRYTLRLYDDTDDAAGVPPPLVLTGGPADALTLVASWAHGRHRELLELPDSGWLDIATDAYRIAALRAMGQIDRALELYESTYRRTPNALSLNVFVGAELLVDAGLQEEAAAACSEGRKLALTINGVSLLAMNSLVELKRLIRHERDLEAARHVLDRLNHEQGLDLVWVREIADMWVGVIALLEGRDRDAVEVLRATVASMLKGDRLAELQAAAIYLAEAKWRCEDEEASDRAADLALEIVGRQGSSHGVLKALEDFPAVASRRLDAEPAADSPWHGLARALAAQRGETVAQSFASAALVREFGVSAVTLDGVDVAPRLTRSVELLAYLATCAEATASREELLDAFFDGRSDDAARSYLRQAIHQARQLVGDTIVVIAEGGAVRVGDARSLTSESLQFERMLAEARRLTGQERLQRTTEALAVYDRGPYLPRARSGWADQRRNDLLQSAVDARFECAELAYATGELHEARRHNESVLAADPFRELAWRLKMKLAAALGDDDGVVRAFRACEGTLAGIDTEPSRDTRRLLQALRG